jgi:Nif11 domain
MPLQSAKDFIDKCSKDEAVRKTARERFQDIDKVGKEHGHDFTKDEFAHAIRERRMAGSDKTGPFCQCQQTEELCVCSNDFCQCPGHEFCQCGTPPPGKP